MKKNLLRIAFLLLLIAGPAEANQDQMHELALHGIDLASSLQFREAVKIFDRMITLEPDNPQAYFLKSATYFWMFSSDMQNEKLGDEFRSHSNKAVEVAEARLEVNKQDIDALFYLGGAYGSLGRYYGLTKSYLNAYWYGKKGVNILEEVVELDSTYYDAYLGLGIYHYLADVLPRFVKILSFVLGIDGDRVQGIRELNIAAQKGIYTKSEALFFLGAIYTYREHEYDRALGIWQKLLLKYPNNPGVLIHLGATYSRMGQCDQALTTYNQVLGGLEKEMLIPISSIHYQMGQVYYKTSQFDQAIGAFHRSINTDSLFSGNRRWTYGWAHYWLARSYEMAGDPKNAQKYYMAISEDDGDRVYRRAQERMQDKPSPFDRSMTIGRNYMECREYENANRVFDQILAANDTLSRYDRTVIEYYKGEVLFNQGNYHNAIQHFDNLISNMVKEEDWFWYWCFYYRGMSYLKMGMAEQAKLEFEKADDTDDEHLIEMIKKEQMLLGS